MMNHEAIRDTQNEAARRILSASKAPTEASKAPTEAGQKPARKPFVAKGHDAILKATQDRKGLVEIMLINTPDPVVGILIARDKYTITVRLPEEEGATTFYKHAIESFTPRKSEVI